MAAGVSSPSRQRAHIVVLQGDAFIEAQQAIRPHRLRCRLVAVEATRSSRLQEGPERPLGANR